LEWLGLIVAVSGLVYLVLPGLSAPPLVSALFMAIAGVAWGFYTLRGKGSSDPLADTGGNFLRSVPMILLAVIPFLSQIQLSERGVILAVISGAVTSGIGYTVWYAALRYHTSTRAAALQLSVPVIAAGIGVILLSDRSTQDRTLRRPDHRRHRNDDRRQVEARLNISVRSRTIVSSPVSYCRFAKANRKKGQRSSQTRRNKMVTQDNATKDFPGSESGYKKDDPNKQAAEPAQQRAALWKTKIRLVRLRKTQELLNRIRVPRIRMKT
jgi:hypothetical protein